MRSNKEKDNVNDCILKNIKPAEVDLPYPPIKVNGRNKYYADILSADYCSAVSEMTAITQYLNHEIRISKKYCDIAATLLSIAEAEMIHFQMIGELIVLLGGCLTYDVNYGSSKNSWKTNYIEYERDLESMIMADIEGEQNAIRQYYDHIKLINDENINAVLSRIIKDEEYHIILLTGLLDSLCDDR